MSHPESHGETTLDPADWSALRALGHRMVDDMFDHQQDQRERPVWQPMTPAVREQFERPLPESGEAAEAIYEDFIKYVMPFGGGNTHARFWGWVMGNGTPLGMLADMLAAGLNPNLGGGDQAPNLVELQVIEWCRQMFDFPGGASGLLLSGGSMANLVGLAVGRHSRAGYDIRQQGLRAAPKPMTIYGSVEMHSSIQKAVELLGLGSQQLRKVAVDERLRVDTHALRAQIEADIDGGYQPICLVGCAGTVNTGAVDPLDELANIAREFNLWYHIDGAFGALAYLAPDFRDRLRGLSRADSLAFDLHKWFYLPFEIGCALVRDEETHRHTFSLRPEYLYHAARGFGGGERWLSDYGVQLSRGFRALKAWMAFRHHGLAQIGELIQQNIDQAAYLAQRLTEAAELELLAPVEMNVVCFRYRGAGLDEPGLDELNEELLYRLQESGEALPSSTHVGGKFALRCAITNHRSRRADFDLLLRQVIELGDALS